MPIIIPLATDHTFATQEEALNVEETEMEKSYWERMASARFSRRQALAAGGTATVAAAILAACGSSKSSSSGGSGGDKTGLITQPVDSSKQSKRGGTLKWFTGNEPAHFDVQIDQVSMNQHKNMVYGHLTNEKAG